MIKYGLISSVDASVLERTIDLICNEFTDTHINLLEIGCYGGDSATGLCQYVFSKYRIPVITGIDNNKDNEPIRFKYDKLIVGNSNEVYNQIPDDSLHLCFIDSCHCFSCVISDFFCYAPKLKKGGYIAFHDTGKHIKPFKDFQHGDKDNPDAYISVRKALTKIGLTFEGDGFQLYPHSYHGSWKLIFDEADESDEAGGMIVLKR